METVRRSYRGASCEGQAIVCCFHGVGADLVLIETLAPIDAYLVLQYMLRGTGSTLLLYFPCAVYMRTSVLHPEPKLA